MKYVWKSEKDQLFNTNVSINQSIGDVSTGFNNSRPRGFVKVRAKMINFYSKCNQSKTKTEET